ncbi:hypothetical protein AX17_007453 [Amanita inopinata Kibby_2008]|nr:hypothetical protein AX17_007453 [Amanita inopinata Kibby_2008]
MAPSFSSSLTASVAASPTPANTGNSPHTTFRSLRSLLPFGPSKNANTSQSSNSTSPQGNTSRNAFSGFGSVRRSLTRERERKTSLTNLLPVIAIDRLSIDQSLEDGSVRRTASFSNIESQSSASPSLKPVLELSTELGSSPVLPQFTPDSAPMLRSISPGPPLSVDLSTIIEADSSCMSKVDPQSSKPSSPVELPPHDILSSSCNGVGARGGNEPDASLDLNTNQVAKQVFDAMMGKDAVGAEEWLKPDKPIVIDADADEDVVANELRTDAASINIENVDPSIVALLTPNNIPKRGDRAAEQIGSNASSSSLDGSNTFSSNAAFSGTSPASQLRKTTPTSSSIPRFRSMFHEPTTPGSTSALSSDTTIKTNVTPLSAHGIQRVRSDVARRRIVTPSPLSASSTPETRIAASTASALPTRHAGRSWSTAPPSTMSAPVTPSSSAPNLAVNARIPSLNSRLQVDSPFEAPSRPLSQTRTPSPTIHAPPLHTPQLSGGATSGSNSSSGLVPTVPNTPVTPNSFIRLAPSISRQNSESANSLRPRLEIDDTTTYDRASLDSRRHRAEATSPDTHVLVTSTPFRRSSDDAPRRPSVGSDAMTSPTSARFDAGRRLHDCDGYLTTTRSEAGDSLSPPFSSSAVMRRDDRSVSPSPKSGLRPVLAAPFRTRKRSMSVQEALKPSLNALARRPEAMLAQRMNGVSRPSTALSHRLGGGRSRDVKEEGDEASRAPLRDWLGPRSAKALRAAGLLDRGSDRELEHDGPLARGFRERSGSVATSVMSGVSARNGTGGLNRFVSAMTRSSASEYSPQHGRTQSRMAFSDVGGPTASVVSGGGSSRRGSGTFSSQALMNSPTFTTSTSGSRDRESRDTPRERDRDRERDRLGDREELKELKEKHATEMGALLGALSDSQRTTRMLREENSDLRDRLDALGDVEAENEGLRRQVRNLKRELSELRIQVLRSNGRVNGSRNGWLSPNGSGRGSGYSTPVEERQEWISRSSVEKDDDDEDDTQVVVPKGLLRPLPKSRPQSFQVSVASTLAPSAPETPRHHRSPSDTSSIFPPVPSNMTMLMHEDNALLADQCSSGGSAGGSANSTTLDASSQTLSRPIPFRKPGTGHGVSAANRSSVRMSMISTASISPTTANFSVVTGSPASLFLRPEHEVHLGDMETFSLDFGTRIEEGCVLDDW